MEVELHSPRQTVRRDFHSTAFLQALYRRHTRETQVELQRDDPQLVEIRIDTGPLRKRVTALAAAVQVLDHPALDEIVEFPEFSPAVTHLEVVLPAHQMLVELLDQVANRLEALLRPGELSDLFPFLLQRFPRRKQVQVPPRSSFQILLISEAVS